jgi:minichromosome maintenance protein 10
MPEQTSQGILGASMNILSDDTEINAPKRDERLALVEDLEVGPVEHKPPFDDPLFEQFEPNSGIRLKCVSISRWR